MAHVCFVYLCDVRYIDKRGLCMLLTGIGGDIVGKGTPSPSQGRATVRLPPSKFFLFFQANFLFFSTLPHKSSNLPIFFPSERFSLPLCVFPYPCIFSRLWGQKTGKIRIAFPPVLPVFVWLLYALFSFSAIFLCCVFLLCLPIVFLSVLCSCIVFCCGCCVFRWFAYSFALCGVFSVFMCNYSSWCFSWLWGEKIGFCVVVG